MSQSGVVSWSQTAATNATADSAINLAEGMAPSALNDSGRAMMASVAKWRDDNAGTLTTGGTSTAYTITSNQVFSSLSALNGQSLRIKFNALNGASPTLNVDTLGAKAIQTVTGTAVGTGVIKANSVYDIVYDNSNSCFILIGAPSDALIAPQGTVMLFQQTAAPTGWTKSAANDNAALRIVSGTASTGGSTNFTSVFTSRTIAQANLPNVSLNPNTASQSLAHTTSSATAITANVGSGQVASAGAGTGVYSSAGFGVFDNHTVNFPTVALGGSGTAMDFAVKYVDVIAASKD